MKCPSCAQHVPLPAAFCLHCGSPLDSGGVRTQQEVPLIGREHEVARLQAFLQEAQAGKGQVVDIIGEPGIGKSRLVDHLRQLSLFDGVTFVHVFCSPVRVGPPGEPIRDMLRQCCGLSATDGRAVVVQQLTWWLSQLDIEPDDVMPYLLHVLTFSVGSNVSRLLVGSDARYLGPTGVIAVDASSGYHASPGHAVDVVRTHWRHLPPTPSPWRCGSHALVASDIVDPGSRTKG